MTEMVTALSYCDSDHFNHRFIIKINDYSMT